MARQVIWRWSLLLQEEQHLTVPRGTEFKNVAQHSSGRPSLYGLTDPSKQSDEVRKIVIRITGAVMDDLKVDYLGSFDMGGYMFHVFEKFDA